MRSRLIPGSVICLAALVLTMAAGGCTVSIQPWTKAAPTAPPPDSVPGSPHGPAQFNGPMPRPLPPGVGSSNESTSQLIKQLNETDDHRKVLLDEVSNLRKQLKDRDGGARQAMYEVEESTKQLKRTRDEFRQWQGEMDELRERVRKLETERASLKPLIDEILSHLERDKDTPKFMRVPVPSK